MIQRIPLASLQFIKIIIFFIDGIIVLYIWISVWQRFYVWVVICVCNMYISLCAELRLFTSYQANTKEHSARIYMKKVNLRIYGSCNGVSITHIMQQILSFVECFQNRFWLYIYIGIHFYNVRIRYTNLTLYRFGSYAELYYNNGVAIQCI